MEVHALCRALCRVDSHSPAFACSSGLDQCCGTAGILGMPNGPFLYADQLLQVLTAKSEQGGFKDLVIYVVCILYPLSFFFLNLSEWAMSLASCTYCTCIWKYVCAREPTLQDMQHIAAAVICDCIHLFLLTCRKHASQALSSRACFQTR